MASVSSRIQIIIDGATAGVEAAAARARTALRGISDEVERNDKVMSKVGTGLATFAKGAAALGALGGTIQIVAGVTAALQQLLPIVLLAPGAILALGAAYATLKIGLSGVSDALGGDAEAMAKLAPAAREAVLAIQALGPAFDKVKQATQQALFKGFASEVRDLGGLYLPVLERGLPKIASGFNAMGRSLAFALKQSPVVESIAVIINNTSRAVGNAKNALGGFASGFIRLGAFGSTYLPRIGIAIDGVAQKFERFVKNGLQDGSIERYVDDAIQGFKDLGAIVGNVFATIGLIFTGLSGGLDSAGVLSNLRETTTALRAFFEQASTLNSLTALGEALQVVADATRNVLIAALEQLAPIIENLAPVVAEIARVFGEQLVNAIGIIGPLIVGLSGFLNEHKEIVGIVAGALLLLYGKFLLFKGITFVAGILGRVVTALGGLSGVLRLLPIAVLAAAAVEIDKINVAAAGGDPEKLTGLADNLHNIVEAGKELLTLNFGKILGDIQSEFEGGDGNTGVANSPIVKNVQEYGRIWGETFTQVGQFTSDFVTKTGESFGKIGQFFADLGRTAQTKIVEIGTFFQELPGKIADALGAAGTSLLDAGTKLVQPIIDGAKQKFEDVKAFFSQSPYEIGLAIGTAIGNLLNSGIALVEQIRLGAVQKFEEVKTFFGTTVPTEIANSLTSLATTLLTKGVEGVQALQDGATQKFEEVKTFFGTTVPENIANALLVLGPQLLQKALDAGQQFLDGCSQKFQEVVDFFAGLPARIFGGIDPVKPGLATRGTEGGQGFLDSVSTKLNEAVEFCRNIPQKISDAIGDLSNLLVGAGKALLDGLTAGMKAGYNALLDFAKGIADGIAAVKGPLPYDRRVLVPAGLAIMGGLLDGMRRGHRDVLAFAGGVAGGLASTVNAATIIRTSAGLTSALNGGSLSSRSSDPTPDLLRQLVELTAQGKDVRVFVGDQEIRSMVRTEIGGSNRQVARTVRSTVRSV